MSLGRASSKQVAVISGSSRGGGKAIAIEMGSAGWTVYVTGRTSLREPSPEGIPGTVEETAEAVTRSGGKGIAVQCDHSLDLDVAKLVERVRTEQGRIDLLVNNAWRGYEHHDVTEFRRPFWEQPLNRWDTMFEGGVRATLLTSSRFGSMFAQQRSGLIVNTVAWLHDNYLGNLYYDAAKAAIIRATFGIATELKPYGVVAVAIAPGFMRTERVMEMHRKHPFDLSKTESPVCLARAVRAITEDQERGEVSGRLLYVGDLAKRYGFTDKEVAADGS